MSHIEEEFSKIEGKRGWHALFNNLANDQSVQTVNKKSDIALLGINRSYNRFRDVLPYDDTRVCLTKGSNNYINANYVQVPTANRKYILTQGPLPTTSNHFWQMVWEQNSRVIVMLTRLIEKGCNKCWLYYPDYQSASELAFDDVDLKVNFVSERQYRHYTQRKFELINLLTGEARPIIHWSDFEWPDHGAPSNPEPFLQLLIDVRHCGAFDPRFGPAIFHCSAGIGRSGTFVLVDSLLKMLANTQSSGDVSLINVLSHIRTQRFGLIQTPEQLRFSYLAVIAGLRMLDKIEQSEELFIDTDLYSSGESDDDDGEMKWSGEEYPKVCGRQDNIMPNSRLNDNLEDINCDLMRRADSNAGSYQPSPQTTHRKISKSGQKLSSEDLNHYSRLSPLITPHDIETSLRRRQERLLQQEEIGKKNSEIKPKVSLTTSVKPSVFSFLPTQYRRPLLIGICALFTGSLFLYQNIFRKDRNR